MRRVKSYLLGGLATIQDLKQKEGHFKSGTTPMCDPCFQSLGMSGEGDAYSLSKHSKKRM